MAYADESPLVGSNYVRAAAANLALADPSALYSAGLGATDSGAAFPPEFAALSPNSAYPGPPYGDPKPNSSLLKRLAERFGLPH
jgi:hypothetical protein